VSGLAGSGLAGSGLAGSGLAGSGLAGLAERAARLGGTLRLGSAAGGGFSLSVSVPYVARGSLAGGLTPHSAVEAAEADSTGNASPASTLAVSTMAATGNGERP
ncbi:MAG TPA: hypothetical protein VGS19_12950, partial [Streptosporangiaceae bacterium]|nr:hypothetical protein [Streptosporangiaceae bacterium]